MERKKDEAITLFREKFFELCNQKTALQSFTGKKHFKAGRKDHWVNVSAIIKCIYNSGRFMGMELIEN
jgi:hypothetical protein